VDVPDATNALTLATSPFLEASKMLSASKEIWSKTKKINTYMLQLKILQTLLACIQVNSTDCFDIILNIHDGLTSARNIINHCTANGVGFRRSNGCKLQMNDNEDNIFLSNVMNNEYTVYM
jgi:hypothetical protein